MLVSALWDSSKGITIFGTFTQHHNTHPQWGKAFLVDGKLHVVVMAMSVAVLCIQITCYIP